MDLDEQLKKTKHLYEKFKVSNVTKNDKMILVEGYIQCKMWFCFYEHFIVCSGDFGEWVFDCTWNTVQDGKPVFSSDLHYLVGKVSKNNNIYRFDGQQCEKDIDEWFRNWLEYYGSDFEYDKDELEEMISSLKYDADDEYRKCSAVDDFMSEFKDITDYNFDDDYELYNIGRIYHPHLVTNLGCLLKIKEYFKEEK